MSLHVCLVSVLFLVGAVYAVANTGTIHIALIFDDGPHASQTEKLLAVFAAEQIHVTFGTVGKAAEANPALLHQVVAAGHEVANHSYSHKQPNSLTAEAVETEVLDGQAKITVSAGVAPRWYWPPFLAIDENVRASVAKAGIRIYSPRKLVASGDYMNEVPAAEIYRRATTGIEDGTVILFHEWRPETAEQIRAVITELKRRGCVFLTFSEMAQYLGQ